ncbi:hypothetical protein [Nakamurella multipartita]|uniref:Uncharacterized protein n=1 Tax=Nakamurella multipartita (strain ATCC 700099 / DSM 44233 / CIP 104796 / JCM 9543 / NBRC 105858 / Y-104) TaxID=479431 RepID=C8XGB3_NAKMY|nr:hypothetical protein [Nakamurella multipartita]ACV80115.1 hypothetical protein Namu_3818 [Nakamurella multipartita DSM 44233]
MSYPAAGVPAPPPPRGKGMLITGAVLLGLGIVGIVLGIVMTVNAATSLLSKIGAAQTAPATFTSQLDGGSTYAVYEATQGTGAATTVQPTAISVTGPSGAVTVSKTGATVNSVGDNNQNYAEVALFTPPTTGSYTITVAGNGAVVAVAPALSTAAKGFAWIVAVIFGGLFAVVGLILLIIGAVRRSSSRRAQPSQFGGPPGAAPAR